MEGYRKVTAMWNRKTEFDFKLLEQIIIQSHCVLTTLCLHCAQVTVWWPSMVEAWREPLISRRLRHSETLGR